MPPETGLPDRVQIFTPLGFSERASGGASVARSFTCWGG